MQSHQPLFLGILETFVINFFNEFILFKATSPSYPTQRPHFTYDLQRTIAYRSPFNFMKSEKRLQIHVSDSPHCLDVKEACKIRRLSIYKNERCKHIFSYNKRERDRLKVTLVHCEECFRVHQQSLREVQLNLGKRVRRFVQFLSRERRSFSEE